MSEIDAQSYNPGNCGGMGPLQIDYAGKTIYNQVNAPCQSAYQSFHIQENGELQYLSSSSAGVATDIMLYPLSPAVFVGTDAFAYQMGISKPGNVADGEDAAPLENYFERAPNGAFEEAGETAVEPGANNGFFLPFLLAGDPSDHLAIAWHNLNGSGDPVGPDVLVPYTAHGAGNLSTTSTLEAIPSSDLTSISAMSISPSSKLLAIGGEGGFELFHWNNPNPITHYSSPLQTGEQFVAFAWDEANHLYALGNGKLFVYIVTPSSIEEAPGSPYSVPNAVSLIVLAK